MAGTAKIGRRIWAAAFCAALAGVFATSQARADCGEAHFISRPAFGLGGAYVGEAFSTFGDDVPDESAYDGALMLWLDSNLHKAGLWEGLCFHISGFQIHGQSITEFGTGSLAPVGAYEALPSTRLNELWLEQSAMDGKLALRFGQIAADSEFMIGKAGDYFLNGAWGWPTIAAADIPDGGPAYPLAAPGVRLAYKPQDDLLIMFAVFNGLAADPCAAENPQICNKHGLNFPLGDDPLLMAEIEYRYEMLGGQDGGLKIGGWYHAGEFQDQFFDVAGDLIAVTGLTGRAIDGDYGLYAIFDQMIWTLEGSDGAQGIAIFGRVMGAPEDRNFIDFYADFGVSFTGFVPGRPEDALAVGFAYTGISDKAVGFDTRTGRIIARKSETLLEVSYTAQLTERWLIQPDFQYFWQPGGVAPLPSEDQVAEEAAVVGLRSTISF